MLTTILASAALVACLSGQGPCTPDQRQIVSEAQARCEAVMEDQVGCFQREAARIETGVTGTYAREQVGTVTILRGGQ